MHTSMAACLSLVVATMAAISPFTSATNTGQSPGADVDRLSWLSGCWTQPRTNGLVEEQWMAPRGGSMLGMSRTVIGDKTVEFEFIRIAVVNGVLSYVAKPSGQAEATFPMKSIEDGVVAFEDLAHDFPQRIIYRRTPDGTVTARVEGTVKGEVRGRDFPYRRCTN